MATPAELFVIVAPEFRDIDFTGAIMVADMEIGQGLCADKRPLLVAYLAAHILTIANPSGGSSANIGSLTEGGTSVRYENMRAVIQTTGLSDTSYGREFDRLRRGCIFAVRTRVNDIRTTNWPYANKFGRDGGL
jgi:hypothetical protein